MTVKIMKKTLKNPKITDSKDKKEKKVSYSVKSLSNKVNVIIPEKFINQVKYLCSKIDKVEWSGVLFYSTKGDVSDIKKFSITLEYVFLMDKGSGGATSYELGEEVVSFRMKHPESLKWKMGHIHSHNSMKAFFSGTDNGELTDNVANYNYYLSVITNNALDFVGKLVFAGEINNGLSYKCKDDTGNPYILELKDSSKVMFERECKFKFPKSITIDDEFKKRTEEVIKKADKAVTLRTYQYGGFGSHVEYGMDGMGGFNLNGPDSFLQSREKNINSKSLRAKDDTLSIEFWDAFNTRYPDSVEFLGYWLSDMGLLNYSMISIVNDFDTKLHAIHWIKSKLQSIKGDFLMYARTQGETPTDASFMYTMDDLAELVEEIEEEYPEFAKLFNEYYDNLEKNFSEHIKILP